MSVQRHDTTESTPLLSQQRDDEQAKESIDFSEEDPDNPRQWSNFKKYSNMAVIAAMAIVSPLASAMFNPAIPIIAEEFNTTTSAVIGSSTGFLIFLGIGPLILAPLSETFGRRNLYLVCFGMFAVLQIPCALSKNVEMLIAFRAVSGFFGSIGIANGGGTLSDMFEPSQRAGVYGYYLLGPLLGPTLGPTFGGIIMEYTGWWPWIFYSLAVVGGINTAAGFVFLKESYAPAILAQRKRNYERESSKAYTYAGEDDRPLSTRIISSMKRPLKILFFQPIVFIMAIYQALLYGIMYTLYTQYPTIFDSPPYSFSSLYVGLLYLAPGLGSLLAVIFLVPRIDTIFNTLTRKNNGVSKPEFRLPLSNLGSILVPISLLWFGWCIDQGVHWAAAVASMPFFTIGQQVIFSGVQNYYIDAFERYSASAIAAGAVFRAIVGGIVPVLGPGLFQSLGYGWGFSLLAGLAVVLAPAPLVFYFYGEKVRERFKVDL